MEKVIFIILFSIIMQSCTKADKNLGVSATDINDVQIECGNVRFQHSLNVNDNTVKNSGDTLYMTAGEMTDLFCDPKGKATNQSAPILLSRVDNTKPFTFTVKVKPQFTKNGTYSAGGIMLFENPEQWQKLCFEQDEAGKHRIVTVRTLEFSDDNNHEQVAGDSVFLRISSDTELIGNYYSEDGENWQLVRVYKNNFLPVVYFCLSAQSPKDKAHSSLFSDVSMVDKPVKNFRTGEL